MDDDSPCVLVRADLRPSTYRAFAAEAAARGNGATVASLLSELADRAIHRVPAKPKPRARRERVPDAVDHRIIELNAQRLTDTAIAKLIGMSQNAVSRRRRLLDLESPRPRGPRKVA